MIRGFVVKECIIDGLMDCTIELLLVYRTVWKTRTRRTGTITYYKIPISCPPVLRPRLLISTETGGQLIGIL